MRQLDRAIVVGVGSALLVAALARADVVTTGGLAKVTHDATLTGKGTTASPLSVFGSPLEVASALVDGDLEVDGNTHLSTANGHGDLTVDGASSLTTVTSTGASTLASSTGNVALGNSGGQVNVGVTGGGTTNLNSPSVVFAQLAHVSAKDAGANRPTLSTCGTSPSVIGTDASGVVTVGTGGASSCVLTFHTAYSSNVSCVATYRSGPLTSYAVTTTTLTMTAAESAGTKLDYECKDH